MSYVSFYGKIRNWICYIVDREMDSLIKLSTEIAMVAVQQLYSLDHTKSMYLEVLLTSIGKWELGRLNKNHALSYSN